jgi:hypothetical protein
MDTRWSERQIGYGPLKPLPRFGVLPDRPSTLGSAGRDSQVSGRVSSGEPKATLLDFAVVESVSLAAARYIKCPSSLGQNSRSEGLTKITRAERTVFFIAKPIA